MSEACIHWWPWGNAETSALVVPVAVRKSQTNEDAADAGTVSAHSGTALWLLLPHHRCDGDAGMLGLWGVWSAAVGEILKNLQKSRHLKEYRVIQNHWHVTEKESYCTAMNPQAGGFVSLDLSLFCTRMCDSCSILSTASNCTTFVENRKKYSSNTIFEPTHKEMCLNFPLEWIEITPFYQHLEDSVIDF